MAPQPLKILRWRSTIVILLGVAVGMFFLFKGRGTRKVTISEIALENRERLVLSSVRDGSLSNDYFVRIEGAEPSEWAYLGWSLDRESQLLTARSADGRFACIYSPHQITPWTQTLLNEMESKPLIVIYDRDSGVVWPTKDAGANFSSFWYSVWLELRRTNPHLPEFP